MNKKILNADISFKILNCLLTDIHTICLSIYIKQCDFLKRYFDYICKTYHMEIACNIHKLQKKRELFHLIINMTYNIYVNIKRKRKSMCM